MQIIKFSARQYSNGMVQGNRSKEKKKRKQETSKRRRKEEKIKSSKEEKKKMTMSLDTVRTYGL
jgi:hypothetical protein